MFSKLFAAACLAGAAIAVEISHEELLQTSACAEAMHDSNWFALGAPYHAKAWTSTSGCEGELYSTPTCEFTDKAGGRVKVSSHFKD